MTIENNNNEYFFTKVDLGRDKKIEVFVTLENRTRLSITVHPNLKVTVKAPESKEKNEIEKYIKKRTQWILKQLNYFDQFQPIQPERKYVSGETHYYLGRQYRLRIIQKKKKQAKLKGKFFEITLLDKTNRLQVESILFDWYREHAKRIFSERIEYYMNYFNQYNISQPELKIRRMKKRWGSCPEGNTILLNTELIKTSKYCVDYVVVHELCHLIYPHHNIKFYELLTRILPDWEKRKDKLEHSLH